MITLSFQVLDSLKCHLRSQSHGGLVKLEVKLNGQPRIHVIRMMDFYGSESVGSVVITEYPSPSRRQSDAEIRISIESTLKSCSLSNRTLSNRLQSYSLREFAAPEIDMRRTEQFFRSPAILSIFSANETNSPFSINHCRYCFAGSTGDAEPSERRIPYLFRSQFGVKACDTRIPKSDVSVSRK